MTTVLVLGGTGFVGRRAAADALVRGADVTTFHRTPGGDVPGVRTVLGDRLRPADLAPLAEHTWDVVVDTWLGAPATVLTSARALAGRVGSYVYVSSAAVYERSALTAPLSEDSPVLDAEPGAEAVAYWVDKRGAERAVEETLGERALLVRPGLVLGPGDNVGHLDWWLGRLVRGGTVPAPGAPTDPLQYVDVRDLCGWFLDAALRGVHGAYNVGCPPGHATTGELLDACVRATGGGATLSWIADPVLAAARVMPFEFPAWLPPDPVSGARVELEVSRAVGAGLACRPVADTVVDAAAEAAEGTRPAITPAPSMGLPLGLSAEREAALLAAG